MYRFVMLVFLSSIFVSSCHTYELTADVPPGWVETFNSRGSEAMLSMSKFSAERGTFGLVVHCEEIPQFPPPRLMESKRNMKGSTLHLFNNADHDVVVLRNEFQAQVFDSSGGDLHTVWVQKVSLEYVRTIGGYASRVISIRGSWPKVRDEEFKTDFDRIYASVVCK